MKILKWTVLCALFFTVDCFVRNRISRNVEDEASDVAKWKEHMEKFEEESTTPEELKEKASDYYSKLTQGQQQFLAHYKNKCIAWIKTIASDEERVELRALYESKDSTVLAEKINDYVQRLPEEKKQKVLLWKAACLYFWNVEEIKESLTRVKRFRRSANAADGHQFLDTAWLSADQKDELSEASTAVAYNTQYMKFYDALSAPEKKAAADKIVKACYAWLTDAQRTEVEGLHHTDHAQCKVKVREYLDAYDGTDKDEIEEHLNVCEDVWYAQHDHSGHGAHGHADHQHHHHRQRRNHPGAHTLEHYFKTHLAWLTAEQQNELTQLKADGKTPEEIQTKVFEFYEAAEGETKTKATELLKGGCRELLQTVVGDEKAAELTALKESGASAEELGKKADELVAGVTDPQKLEAAKKYGPSCKKLYGVVSRMRRTLTLEDAFTSHLSWLSEAQKDELKGLKTAGEDAKVQPKIKEFFDALEGEAKTKATELLKGGCRELLKSVVGEDKASELKTLKESGASDADIEKKVSEFLAGVTDPAKQEIAKKYGPECKKLFGVATRMRRHHEDGEHMAHHGDHKLEDYFKTHLAWLTEEQKTELKQMKADGKTPEEIQKKVFEFYDAATGETKTKATELLQGGCRELLKSVVGEEKAAELKTLKESGASEADLGKKADELLSGVTDPHKQEVAKKYGSSCKRLFGVSSRMRRTLSLEKALDTHLSWLTKEQKDELNQIKESGETENIQPKVMEFYEALEGEAKTKATELLKGGCRELLKSVVGEDKATELKDLKDSGASAEDIEKKVTEFLAEITDAHKNEIARKYGPECKKLFGVGSRKRRGEPVLDDYFKTHLAWLTEEQKTELKQLKADGKTPEEIQKKIFEYYDAAEGETKTKATELLKGGCREFLKSVVGEEKAAELKTLKESGASNEDIQKKADEFLAGVTDPAKQETAKKYGSSCKRLFGVASRLRRHNGKTDLQDFIDNHLTWLTDEQKVEIEKLKEDRPAFEKQVNTYYDLTTGETRVQATEQLQGACRELMEDVLGDKVSEITKLKEAGANKEDMYAKVEELLAGVSEGEKKQRAQAYKNSCKKYFGVAARMRRHHEDGEHMTHHGDHKLEDYFKTHLAWLTEEQKTELKQMKADGKTPEEIQTKVFEFYDAAEGETKTKATELLQGGCRELLKIVVGEEKAAELKTLKESGASEADLGKKADELLSGVTDPHKQEVAKKYGSSCKRLFGVSSRKRRTLTLEDAFSSHLSWLSEAQKDELKGFKTAGEDAKIQPKIKEFFDALEGEAKTKATELLKGGCRELLKSVVGEDKASELKTLKQSGASDADIEKKVSEFLAGVTDPAKQEIAKKYGPECKKLFGVAARMKRNHHGNHTLDDYFKTHLAWLTTEQQDELKQLKADGKGQTDLQKKVFEFYDAATGETKVRATELLQGGCRELITKTIGAEKAAEVKQLKESGASPEDLFKKVESFVDASTDEHAKAMANQYKDTCKKVFSVASRMKRDHHDGHKLEDYFKTYLAWLTTEQQDELKQLKADGKTADELGAKVFELYDAAEGEAKTKATELLKGGCRELLKSVVGEDKATELKDLKDSGASAEDIEKKVAELMTGVTDPAKQEVAKKYGSACKRVFGVASRMRRDDVHVHEDDETLEGFVNNHMQWLTAEQKAEVLKFKDASAPEAKAKIQEFYQLTTGETRVQATEGFKSACREMVVRVLGAEKAGEIKKMKESGKTYDEMLAKYEEFAQGVTDEKAKKAIADYGEGCKQVFKDSARMKRDHKLDDYFKTHLAWLTTEQQDELKQLKADGKTPEEIQKKIFEYYDAAEGETKTKATELLQGGCRELLKSVVGEDKAAELKTLKESGASNEDIEKKVAEFMTGVTDPHKQEVAKKYGSSCKRLFGVSSRKRRTLTLEDAFKTHLSWLSEAQKDELKGFKTAGEDAKIQPKIKEFFDALEGEAKTKATELLKGGCRELLKSVVGEDKASELKTLKESGASDADIEKKVSEFLAGVTDPAKQEIAKKYGPECKKLFGVAARMRRHKGVSSRSRRDHKLEDYFKTHLAWLTEEQKTQLKQFKEDGVTSEELQIKVMEFYQNTEGETRTKAKEQLQGGCRELLKSVVGEDKAAELKTLKESGASDEDVSKKADEFLAEVTDEHKKELGKKYGPSCKKLYGVTARMRRHHEDGEHMAHHGDHKLEDYFKTHLAWLTEEQKTELKQLKADGKTPEEIQTKVFEFYDAAEGETKTKATELLQGGCRELLKIVVGEEKAAELKTLKESGASEADLGKKADELLSGVTDPHKQEVAKKYGSSCKRLFGVASRKRRTLTLEEAFKTHLSWLTEDQQNSLRKLREDGKDGDEIQDLVFEYYDAAEGETKTKATELLQGGCKAILAKVLDPEDMQEIKAMKDSGKTIEEIRSKVVEFINEVADEDKKQLISRYSAPCKRVYGLGAAASRKRRAMKPVLTHIDFMKAVLQYDADLDEETPREMSHQIVKIYGSVDVSEHARVVVNQCHRLFAEAVPIRFYMDDNSGSELYYALSSASNRQLSSVAVVAKVCIQTLEDIERNEGKYGSIGHTLISMFNDLDSESKARLGQQWRSKCIDWVLEVTDEEERSFLAMLLRTKQFEPLRERVNEFIARFDDTTKTQVSHMRPVCEKLLGVNHSFDGRKSPKHLVPAF